MPRDLVRETTFEAELNSYTSAEENPLAYLLSEAFRNHGLLMLYRLCGRTVHFALEVGPDSEEGTSKCPIRALALRTLEMLFITPVDSPYVNLHTLPLLSAAAELESTDTELRERVIEQLQVVYSTNRIPPTLWVIELLQELWNLRDSGIETTWLDLMLVKQWRLRIG
jgi:molybdopterin-guanine dinucleotide biosynthesis protein A